MAVRWLEEGLFVGASDVDRRSVWTRRRRGPDAVRLAILADGWVASALVFELFGVASANFVGATDFVVPPAAWEVC